MTNADDARPTHQSITDAAGTAHFTVSYPFANTVGCSCGWSRRFVNPDVHDDLIEAHLNAHRPAGNMRVVE